MSKEFKIARKFAIARIPIGLLATVAMTLILGVSISLGSKTNAAPEGDYALAGTNSSFSYASTAGGTVTVTATDISPTTQENEICDNGSRDRPNFKYSLSNTKVRLGTSGSKLIYNLDFGFRKCNKDITGYAIYSQDYCDLAGHYGGSGDGFAYDCIKYAQSIDDNQVNGALGCAVNGSAIASKGGGAPTFYPCTLPTFQAIRIDKAAYPYAPGGTLKTKTIANYELPKGADYINGLRANTSSDGQRKFNAKLCQYWAYTDGSGKTSATNEDDDDCKPISFNIEWKYTPPPSYSLSAYVNDLAGDFSFFQDMPNPWNWGMTVDSEANLSSDGIGAHNLDLWRLTFDGNPPGWAAGTLTYGDAGMCDAIAGEADCERFATNACSPAACGDVRTGQSWNFVESRGSGPHNPGKSVCFISRVSMPNQSSNQNEWKTSRMVCARSVKKPRVQFLGSDVRVAGSAISSTYSVQGKNYGSWAEYGVLTQFNNANVTSGNTYREPNGATSTESNTLTFANINGPSNYGSFNPIPNLASESQWVYNYFNTLPDSGAGIPAAGVYTNTSGTLNGLTVSTKNTPVIIKRAGTLRITNNIIVNATGFPDARSLSQVVIVADAITIDKNVDRIDAWLVTKPGVNWPSGSINTCDDPAALTTNVCTNPLTVNGPVYTQRLLLRRTAGGDLPVENINNPSERFNLRPDAQLWAYNYANKADYAQTDYVQELPPRY